mmetsp:Transcript_42623/g.126428  ORF Transcript_42623/g.126428 Transcript_42623/m.126428 type:complete len:228 (+) Transcript_42623:897-1580(+)
MVLVDKEDRPGEADKHQQDEDPADRPHGRVHPLDDHQDLRERAHQLGHASHTEKPQQSQRAQLAERPAVPQDGQNRRLEDHHAHQDGVEDEPPVQDASPHLPEPEEADQDLAREVDAERDLADDESDRAVEEVVGLAEPRRVVGIPANLNGIEGDHENRYGLERLVLGEAAEEAVAKLRVLLFADRLVVNTLLQLPGGGEQAGRLLPGAPPLPALVEVLLQVQQIHS